jgi:hypothetical protein
MRVIGYLPGSILLYLRQRDHDLDCCRGNHSAMLDRPMAHVAHFRLVQLWENLKNLFFCRELYRRTGESSSERVIGESRGFASLG